MGRGEAGLPVHLREGQPPRDVGRSGGLLPAPPRVSERRRRGPRVGARPHDGGRAKGRVVVVDDAGALAREAARGVRAPVQRGRIASRGRFTVALSGGSTPGSCMRCWPIRRHLSRRGPVEQRAPLLERRTARAAGGFPEQLPDGEREALISRVPIPASNVHRIEAELPDAAEAAARYDAELAGFFALSPGDFPRFDLMLLGIGPEGHTASLFPDTKALGVRDKRVVENWVPS